MREMVDYPAIHLSDMGDSFVANRTKGLQHVHLGITNGESERAESWSDSSINEYVYRYSRSTSRYRST